ncbi:MAG: peptidoglycan DD-metalloendopeptidase family protein [Desulfuromusa sp.]|jgi:murein DD-endopeptidase|nr:peptidoglycan DD-metalloendopeptidase family protein [Desulfuromusa sp.]
MNTIWKPTPNPQSKQRRSRRFLLLAVVLVVMILGGYFLTDFSQPPELIVTEQPPFKEEPVHIIDTNTPLKDNPQNLIPDHISKRTITSGDNLSAIFDSVEISQSIMVQILAADESLLALDILRPGNTLTFTLDEETRQLVEMELFIHPAHQVVYHRVDENSFDYEEIILPGEWEQQLIYGEIDGSFYLSAIKAGLSEQEAGNIAYLFKSKLNFSRDIRAGDHFQVIRSLQLIDRKLTGQSQIEGVRIFSRNRYYSAFLFEDGNFYDDQGESLARAFQRYPYKGRYRVSSAFNPTRLHPITGRIAPHKGVDFAMPVGTPIYATGDGEITRVKNHPFAGKYIEIQHDGRYLTRYLHLNKITVKRGQKIKRGERIASSGNTGRSTGPHLHYELHIKGRAVNPVTANIPMATSIAKNKFKTFQQRISELIVLMEQSQEDLVGT